jgi:hypothetical protein
VKRIFFLLLAVIVFAVIHEGLHALIAIPFGEYRNILVKPYGLEVIFVTPPEERSGIQWFFISGVSNIATVLLGYILLSQHERIARMSSGFFRSWGYWQMIIFLLADPLNLSIGPFLYGGDALGIQLGLGVNIYIIQSVFLIVLLVNRELIVQWLLPTFGIKTRHPLFIPWLRLPKTRPGEIT